MRAARLCLFDVRCIERAELDLEAGINWVLGRNGAGKTSVLEALSLLATGRTFRAGSVDSLIRRDARKAVAFAEMVDESSGVLSRVGLERESRQFRARVDGEEGLGLARLFEKCPVVCVEPDSGLLIAGPGELRRRFLDWGLFHVEHGFLTVWRRFQRALKQRNALLRLRRASQELDAWDREFAESGDQLHRLRRDYCVRLGQRGREAWDWLLPDLGHGHLAYRPGWPSEDESLQDALLRHRATDLRMGFSGLGPQRAGWSLSFDKVPAREQFSRGQAKLAAMAMLITQVADFADSRGQSPIVCLDDVMSELDPAHQSRLLQRLGETGSQVLITTPDPSIPERLGLTTALFHVEQGVVTRRV